MLAALVHIVPYQQDYGKAAKTSEGITLQLQIPSDEIICISTIIPQKEEELGLILLNAFLWTCDDTTLGVRVEVGNIDILWGKGGPR